MHGPLPVPTRLERPYYESGRDGKLRLQRCTACGHTYFPPNARCVACGSRDVRWTEMSGRGRIWSWVIFRKQYFEQMPTPYTVVRVQLEEGPYLITNLVDAAGREPAIDAPVRAVFQRIGDLYLPQFTPVT
jgi:uncharacterized OB-fold protein